MYKAWSEMHTGEMRQAWEMMRLHATITVQPHCKKKMRPKDIIALPWDGESKVHDKQQIMSREESKKRYEQLQSKLRPGKAAPDDIADERNCEEG